MWSGEDNSLSSSSSSSPSSSSSSSPSSLPSGLLSSFPSSLARRQGANQQQLHNTQVCLKMKTRECAKICPRVWPIPRLSMCVAVLLHQCPCAPCDTLMYMWGHYPISGDTGQNVSMAHHRLGNKVACRSTYKLVSTEGVLGQFLTPNACMGHLIFTGQQELFHAWEQFSELKCEFCWNSAHEPGVCVTLKHLWTTSQIKQQNCKTHTSVL